MMNLQSKCNNRKANSLKRLIRNAGFDQPEAYIADINYTSGRELNRNLIERLFTCEYITEHRNLFITGATGSGKTYLVCAFGMEACKQRYRTKYVRLPDMLLELELTHSAGTYKKVMSKYANPVVLILDEWLLLKPTEEEQHDILELLHRRSLLRFSARSMNRMAGMISWEAMTVHWLRRFGIALSMMLTRLILYQLIPPIIAQ